MPGVTYVHSQQLLAAWKCGTHLHDSLHVSSDLGSVQVALGVAHLVQPRYGVLASVLRQVLVRLVGLHCLRCSIQ